MPLPALSIEVPSGPARWTDYSGPFLKPELKSGERAWAVLPVSAGWETLKWTLLPVDRVDGQDVVFKPPGNDRREFFVPAAFVSLARPAEGLVKGDAVAVAANASRAFARVTALEGGKVKVRFRFAGDVQELDVDPIELIKLDGTLKYGSVVGYAESRENPGKAPTIDWRPAHFVHTEGEQSWIVSTSGRPQRVPAGAVKPLSVHITHKTGDQVWFAKGDKLEPAVVVESEDDGLRYKIKLDSGEETSAPFDTVSTPVK